MDNNFEDLTKVLHDPARLEAYKQPYDDYRAALLPRICAKLLVLSGNVVYGSKPSYLRFRSIEVIARVPYFSWTSAMYTLLTLCYTDGERAIALSRTTNFARIAQDNETMHVVVISQFARSEERAGVMRHTIIPMLFAFFYFWASYVLYFIKPQWSYEINYLFEQHAFEQYSEFLNTYEAMLKQKPAESAFLAWYGRVPKNQYNFFLSVRNDEIIHRNESIMKIKEMQRGGR